MKKFFNQARGEFHNMFNDDNHASSHHHSGQQKVLAKPAPPISAPTRDDVIRYRYHHGTNLGSIYVLEKWLHGSMFPSDAPSNQTAELAAAQLNVKQMGMDGARKKHEDHWRNSLSDSDMDWLANEAKCTSIRLPIGYFTLGPSFCNNTPFEKVAPVYLNAWPSVRNLVSRCSAHGIGVLIDFHSLPGGANGGEHSGTNSGKAEFWNSKSNIELANRCLQFIAQEIRNGMDGVIGLQLCNEADHNAPGMYAWYDSIINSIGAIDNTIPIYISDAWNMGQAVDYVKKKNSLANGYSNPVIIDTHLYWAFSDADKSRPPQAIINEVPSKLSELDGKDGNVIDGGAAQAVVGEYSCVLDGQTWDKKGGASREQLVQQFGCAQSQRYQQRSGGSYFWTFKMDWMDGGEWGFAEMTKKSCCPPPPNLTLSSYDVQHRIQQAQSQQQHKMRDSVNGHVNYWNSNSPNKQFEHWRFENGWQVGWNDANAFFGARVNSELPGQGGDKIGMLDCWVRKRVLESGQTGEFLWEFEQGMRTGVRDFYQCAGI